MAQIQKITGLTPGAGAALTSTYCQWSDASGVTVLSLGKYDASQKIRPFFAMYEQMGKQADVVVAGAVFARASATLDGMGSSVIAKLAGGGLLRVAGNAPAAQMTQLAVLALQK